MEVEKGKRSFRQKPIMLIFPFLIGILLCNIGTFLLPNNSSGILFPQNVSSFIFYQQLTTIGLFLICIGIISLIGAIICGFPSVFRRLLKKKQPSSLTLSAFFLLLVGILLALAGEFLLSRNPQGTLSPQSSPDFPSLYDDFCIYSLNLGIIMLIGAIVLTFQWIEKEKLKYSFAWLFFFLMSVLSLSIFLMLHNPPDLHSPSLRAIAGVAVSFLVGMIFLISSLVSVFKWMRQKNQGYALAPFLFFLLSCLSLSIFFIPGHPSGLHAPSSGVDVLLFCFGMIFLISAILAMFKWMRQKNRGYMLAALLCFPVSVLLYYLYLSRSDTFPSPAASALFLAGMIFLISAIIAIIFDNLKRVNR